MSNKYLKKFLTPLAIKEIKIKITLRFMASKSEELMSEKNYNTHQ